jgi:hypothetical protein
MAKRVVSRVGDTVFTYEVTLNGYALIYLGSRPSIDSAVEAPSFEGCIPYLPVQQRAVPTPLYDDALYEQLCALTYQHAYDSYDGEGKSKYAALRA